MERRVRRRRIRGAGCRVSLHTPPPLPMQRSTDPMVSAVCSYSRAVATGQAPSRAPERCLHRRSPEVTLGAVDRHAPARQKYFQALDAGKTRAPEDPGVPYVRRDRRRPLGHCGKRARVVRGKKITCVFMRGRGMHFAQVRAMRAQAARGSRRPSNHARRCTRMRWCPASRCTPSSARFTPTLAGCTSARSALMPGHPSELRLSPKSPEASACRVASRPGPG